MNRNELLSISGLRSDGRKADEIRRVATSLGTYKDCDGSAYLEMGNTKVQAIVYGPRECSKRSMALESKAIVTSDVTISPFAGMERHFYASNSKPALEISTAIRRCFSQVIQTELYPRSEIGIHCTVIQSDGGELSCCLNAALLALINAGIAVSDFQVSLEVGYMDNTIILDMNRNECRLNGIVLTVAYLPRVDKFTFVTIDNNIPIELFEEILNSAKEGCKQVYSILSADVMENAKKMFLQMEIKK